MAESLPNNMVVESATTPLNDLLGLVVEKVGKSSVCDDIKMSISKMSHVKKLISTLYECVGVGMTLNPHSLETGGDGVEWDNTERSLGWDFDVESGGEDLEPSTMLGSSKWINAVCAVICIVCAATAAGLTMGFVSIDPLEMEIKQRSGTEVERKQAGILLPLIRRHHYLLVALLLFNAVAAEALPIFLHTLVPTVAAVVLSVTAILVFGEILPSAIFTGRHQYLIASRLAPIVCFLMFIFAPIAWPVGKALGFFLGHEAYKKYSRAEISALMEVQRSVQKNTENAHDEAEYAPLHEDEVAIVSGVLQTYKKSVKDAMIPLDRVYCLPIDTKLDKNTMADIMAAGYSRVLVYEGETENIRGYFQVKRLIVLNPDDERVIRSLYLRQPQVVSPEESLLELLNIFQMGHSHMALVSHYPLLTTATMRNNSKLAGKVTPIGIITLEDIFEEIIQEEIYDETDSLALDIEARANATLKKYTRRRRMRRSVPSGSNAPTFLQCSLNRKIQSDESMFKLDSPSGSSRSTGVISRGKQDHPYQKKKSRALLMHTYVEQSRNQFNPPKEPKGKEDEKRANTSTFLVDGGNNWWQRLRNRLTPSTRRMKQVEYASTQSLLTAPENNINNTSYQTCDYSTVQSSYGSRHDDLDLSDVALSL